MIFKTTWIKVRPGVYNLKYFGPKHLLPQVGDILTIEGKSGKYKTVDINYMLKCTINKMNQYASAEFSVNT